MTKIKLCGLSRLDDINVANELPIDYVGFVFAKKSKRYVSMDTAKQLKNALNPKIKAVGVFVNEDIEEIVKLVDDAIIDVIQLHGDEDEEYIATLRVRLMHLFENPPIPKIIKAFKMKGANIITENPSTKNNNIKNIESLNELDKNNTNKISDHQNLLSLIHSSTADYILLDSPIAGSGESFDWNMLKDIKREFFLAGGLNIENIELAVKNVHPFGVDTSSGIETNGLKDEKKMRKFVEMVGN